jgi:amidase
MPELALLAFTEARVYGGPTRNPWNLERIPGGSSGGSAAAVAARMAPIAVGSDGLGSIRIPSACCGLFGLKPGFGLLPQAEIGGWFGQSEFGPMATTVEDAALLLGVMAGAPIEIEPPRRRKIAVWTRSPAHGIGVDRQVRDAIRALADRLEQLGHDVHRAKTPRSLSIANALLRRWFLFAAADAETLGLDIDSLEPLTRAYVRRGQKALRKGGPNERDVEAIRRLLTDTFGRCDLVVSPVLARPPLAIDDYSSRFYAMLLRHTKLTPFTPMWNLAQYPAAALPVGTDRDGLPIGAMIGGPPKSETSILSVARQLEEQQPWPRHAPK